MESSTGQTTNKFLLAFTINRGQFTIYILNTKLFYDTNKKQHFSGLSTQINISTSNKFQVTETSTLSFYYHDKVFPDNFNLHRLNHRILHKCFKSGKKMSEL